MHSWITQVIRSIMNPTDKYITDIRECIIGGAKYFCGPSLSGHNLFLPFDFIFIDLKLWFKLVSINDAHRLNTVSSVDLSTHHWLIVIPKLVSKKHMLILPNLTNDYEGGVL